MRTLLILFTLLCVILPSHAQDESTGTKQDTLRSYSVKVVDRKGKPLSGLVVSYTRQGTVFLTNEKGLVNLEAVNDADSIVVFLPNIGETHIPCRGTDSLLITVRSKKRFRVQDRKELVNLRTHPSNTIEDVPELLKRRPARDLAELLSGQIPGLFITMGANGITANIRGIGSINSNTEPLIVVDGMTYDSFSTVNSFLDIQSIQSVQVQKDGGMYGMRGSGGVIIITTKGASANPLSY